MATARFAECRRALLPTGTFVACSTGDGDWVGPLLRIAGMLFLSLFTSVIERVYSLSEVAAAFHHVGAGHVQGQLVIGIAAQS